MSDTTTPPADEPKQEPFAGPLPEVKTEPELEEGQEPPPKPTLDEDVYATDPTKDSRATHHAMSTEELAKIGCDEDGNPIPPEPPVEPPPEEDPPAEETLP